MTRTFIAIRDLPSEQHRRWLLVAAVGAFLGYSASLGSQLVTDRGLHRGNVVEVVVLFATVMAILAVLQARHRLATWLLLGSVWVELSWSLFQSDVGLHTPTMFGFVPLIVGVGLIMGIRAALVVAATTIVSVVAFPMLGYRLGLGTGLLEGDVFHIVVFDGSILVVVLLLAVFLRTFAVALEQVERHAAKATELVEETPDAIVAFDPDGRIEAFNRAAEYLLGIDRSEILGGEASELPLEILGEQDSEEGGGSALSEVVLSESGPFEIGVVGQDKFLEVLSRRSTRPDGTKGTLLVLRDITERRRAEKRARELQHQLEHAQRMEAVGQLAGGVAHDMNNLLTVVAGYGSLLLNSSDAKARDMASELLQVQERGSAMTRQLLAFARRDTAQPQALDLSAVLKRMAALIERLVGEGVTLIMDLSGPCPIFADPGQIEQVVLNLVANARDALGDKGTIYIGTTDGDPDVILVVRDDGVGMSAETIDHIFEPFFTMKSRGEGTGLGLSTVQGIVSEAGGRIEVDTKPGSGTTFTIFWPRTDVIKEPTPPSIEVTKDPRRQGTILLVEDDDHARTFIRRVLEHAGFEVHEAAQASEALETAAQTDAGFDLVLTDVIMPGMNGVELAHRLWESRPDQTILLMSGYLDQKLDNPVFDSTEDLILKPFKGEELLERIDRKLGK